MISLTPTEEQQMLIDTVRRYATHDVRPCAHDADETGAFPDSVIQRGWEIGLLPGNIPESMGGLGDVHSAVTGVLAYEELAYGDLALALHLMTPALVAIPLVLDGTDAQREDFLPLFLDERPPRVTAALIEPRIAFDPGELKTVAAPTDGGYELFGQKATVPLAEGADWLLIYAGNAETGQVDGFLVAGDAPGLTVGPREKLMGVRALPTYPVMLDGVRVEAAYRLGGDQGCDYARLQAYSRAALGALAVGVMRGAVEYAVNYAKERVQFGAPIATRQAIAFMLADGAIEVDAARLMVWEAAWLLDQGRDAARESYLAGQYAAQAALTVADSAVQTLGGYGYIREYPVERWLRNARGFAAFHGLAMV
jgi:acyl-CoA dehydrogenase